MALEWLNTAANWLDTGGQVLNAVQPFLNLGASVYDRNQRTNAIGDAFGDYRAYADKSQNTLGEIYNQARQSFRPYQAAGTSSLAGYQRLLRNPGQITSDPGYQFRFNQGQEALQRSAASKRMLNSGNFATAAQQYGQGFATSELDNALARYLPMIQAGQNATGQQVQAGQNYGNATAAINLGLGEAAAGSRIGQAGANTRLVTDFLGLTGGQTNPFGQAADAARGVKTLADGVNKLGTLFNGGSAASGVSGLGTAGATTAGSALGTLGAPTGASQVAGMVPAGSQYAGMLTTMDALGGGAGVTGAGTTAAGTGTAGAGSATAGTAGASGAGSAGTAGLSTVAGTAMFAAPFIMAAISKFGKGGSAESAKSGKLAQQLQRDAQADPSGRAAQATIDRLINGQLWPGEGNQWVISDLMKSGVVTLNTPSLYSRNSVVDVFAPANSVYNLNSQDRNSFANANIWAQSGGLNPQQADQFRNLTQKYHQAKEQADDGTNGSMVKMRARVDMQQAKTELDKMIAQIEHGRQRSARTTYNTLRSQGYRGDLSKLETYLGVR